MRDADFGRELSQLFDLHEAEQERNRKQAEDVQSERAEERRKQEEEKAALTAEIRELQTGGGSCKNQDGPALSDSEILYNVHPNII